MTIQENSYTEPNKIYINHSRIFWQGKKTFYMSLSISIVLRIVNKLINNRSASLAWQYTAKHLYFHTLLQNDSTLRFTRHHQGLPYTGVYASSFEEKGFPSAMPHLVTCLWILHKQIEHNEICI